MKLDPAALIRPARLPDAELLSLPQDAAWRHLASAADDQLSLTWGALVLARDEYPDLDLAACVAELARVARPLRDLEPAAEDPFSALRAINQALFDDGGFSGNQQDFYDPRNSYLNQVLDRRLGIPITLALVQLDVASRVGLPLCGISFPGHFLVSLPLEGGMLVLDPFHRGRSIDLDELKARARPHIEGGEVEDEQLSELLAPAGNRTILARMLRNLKGLYTEQRDFERALRSVERVLMLEPESPFDLRDRGLIYLEIGYYAGARADLTRYLAITPQPDDADKVRRQLLKAGRTATRVN